MIKILYISFYDQDKPVFGNKYFVNYVNIFSKYQNSFLWFRNDILFSTKSNNYDLVIIGGGIQGIPIASELRNYVPELYDLIISIEGTKVLGICYGFEFLYNLYYNRPLLPLSIRNKRSTVIRLKDKNSSAHDFSIRFNHKYYCPYIKDGIIAKYFIPKESITIPILVKFTPNHYGCQFHFKTQNDLINFIDLII